MAKHAANHSLRRVIALAVTAAALLALPGSAGASIAKTDGSGKLVYTAAPGEANDLTVAYASPGVVNLSEAGHYGALPIVIGGSGGCSGVAAAITCSGVTSVELKLGDGDDRVAAHNGSVDKISCGSGSDTVYADPADNVAADCESVDRTTILTTTSPGSSGSGTTTGGTTTTTTTSGGGTTSTPVGGDGGFSDLDEPSPFVNVAPPVIPRQTAGVSPSGVASVRVACPPEAIECRGTVALVLVNSASKARARVVAVAAAAPKGITLGRAKFTAKGGQKPFVQVRLNRRGRQRILRARHTRCRLVVTTRSSDGKVVTTSRSITLRPRRSTGRKSR